MFKFKLPTKYFLLNYKRNSSSLYKEKRSFRNKSFRCLRYPLYKEFFINYSELGKILGKNLILYNLTFLNIFLIFFRSKFKIQKIELAMLYGIFILEFYNNFIHASFGMEKRYPYFPLMLTSCYTALIIFYCWLKFLFIITFTKIEYY